MRAIVDGIKNRISIHFHFSLFGGKFINPKLWSAKMTQYRVSINNGGVETYKLAALVGLAITNTWTEFEIKGVVNMSVGQILEITNASFPYKNFIITRVQ